MAQRSVVTDLSAVTECCLLPRPDLACADDWHHAVVPWALTIVDIMASEGVTAVRQKLRRDWSLRGDANVLTWSYNEKMLPFSCKSAHSLFLICSLRSARKKLWTVEWLWRHPANCLRSPASVTPIVKCRLQGRDANIHTIGPGCSCVMAWRPHRTWIPAARWVQFTVVKPMIR